MCSTVQLGSVASVNHLLYKLQLQLFCEPLCDPFIHFSLCLFPVWYVLLLPPSWKPCKEHFPEDGPLVYRATWLPIIIFYMNATLNCINSRVKNRLALPRLRQHPWHTLYLNEISSAEVALSTISVFLRTPKLFINANPNSNHFILQQSWKKKINAVYVFKEHSSSFGLSEFE